MGSVKLLLTRLVGDETGGEVLEYALIAGLIVVAAIAVITSVGTKVLGRWTSADASLQAGAEMTTHGVLVCAPIIGLLVWAAAVDLHSRRIPNWLSFSLILSGLAISFSGFGMVSPWQSLGGFLAGVALPLALFVMGALGGGDVKLLAGVGAWLGAEAALKVFVIAAVVGAAIVLVQALIQGRTRTLLRNSTVLAINLAHVGDVGADHVRETGKASKSVDRPLPYAVPVLVAVLILVACSWR